MRKLLPINQMIKNTGIALVFTALAGAALAQEADKPDQDQEALPTMLLKQTVVTGTRFETPEEQSGKTIYKITSKQIEQNAGKSVADLLNEVPGIQMDGNFGAPGTNLGYFVRGGSSSQTLVLIDGVPMNDPSGISSSYDLRLLATSQIESIEVLKGGLSTLYGTGAAAAVINITLKDATDKPIAGSASLSGGSFGTFSQDVNLNGDMKGLTYMVTASNTQSQGFSAAQDQTGDGNFDDDPFSQRSVLIKLGKRLGERLDIGLIAAHDRFESDYDAGRFADAPDNVQNNQQTRVGIKAGLNYDKGKFELNTVFNANEREFDSSFPSQFEGKNLQVDLNQQHYFSDQLKGLFGLNIQDFRYKQEGGVDFENTNFTLVDPYASIVYNSYNGFNLHVGARLNTHSEYDPKLIFNVNPSYLIGQDGYARLKLLASVATSYITPSPYQLYSAFGNTDLNPEESLNIEGGTTLYFGEWLSVNTVYYRRFEEESIDFVSFFDENGDFIGGQYDNVAPEREVYGVEVDATITLLENLSFAANYTYADTDLQSSFSRIPKHKYGATINYSPTSALQCSFKYNHTGERRIFGFGGVEEVALRKFDLVDLFVSYGFMEGKLNVFGAANNIFDESFVGVRGFETRGRNFNCGVRYKF